MENCSNSTSGVNSKELWRYLLAFSQHCNTGHTGTSDQYQSWYTEPVWSWKTNRETSDGLWTWTQMLWVQESALRYPPFIYEAALGLGCRGSQWSLAVLGFCLGVLGDGSGPTVGCWPSPRRKCSQTGRASDTETQYWLWHTGKESLKYDEALERSDRTLHSIHLSYIFWICHRELSDIGNYWSN